MKVKITINSRVKEKDLVESCLNMFYSGSDSRIILLFHALTNTWHKNKLMYYMGLMTATASNTNIQGGKK